MKKGYFYSNNFWEATGEIEIPRVIYVIICCLFVISTILLPIFWTQLQRERYSLGDGYLKLAEESSSIEMAIGYLESYRESVKSNGFDKGSAGLFYKTPNNNMANRYERLVKGIEFLKMFTGKTELDSRINTLDINMYSMMVDNDSDKPALKNYISSLNVGIDQYLSANYLWWRICDIGGLVTLILVIVGGLTVFIMGIIGHIDT